MDSGNIPKHAGEAVYRITEHPILPIPKGETVEFTWQGQALTARVGEMISSALFAHGIRTFGHHPKDGAPLGIFCANGQCAQCMVLVNGRSMKACMTPVAAGMRVEPMNGLPVLPKVERPPVMEPPPTLETPVLIIGGGPAGMSAAIQLGKLGVKTLLIDDKTRLGGKLVLQTHRFFGSVSAVYAGTRGIDIATKLENEVRQYPSVEVWTGSTAMAVFSDKKVGVLKGGERYVLVQPQVLLVAAGAREKSLIFQGNTLPGVYGAGAFQTLVNRDLVKAAERLFIVGGGNVGLITGYHALQAGIQVVGLAEALPRCGGYQVHQDKLARMGVPIYTSHTILSANAGPGGAGSASGRACGDKQVESVTIAQVDERFQPIPGTEKSFACDTLLIAVGLDSISEFTVKARDYGIPVFAAGDAKEIAEASSAMFSGKIAGLEVAQTLGCPVSAIPAEWYRTGEILKSKPGREYPEVLPEDRRGVTPVIHCTQEIPCNPCSALCPNGLIYIDSSDIRSVPVFLGDNSCCQVCERCVVGCPGLAITLVDYHSNPDLPVVSIPYEFSRALLQAKDQVTVEDIHGQPLGEVEVLGVHAVKGSDRTLVVQVQAPAEYANRIAGLRVQDEQVVQPLEQYVSYIDDDMIVCRCERVTAGEIRRLIREGYVSTRPQTEHPQPSGCRDMNEIKAITRSSMGACGGKTCAALIHRLFREEGIPDEEVMDNVKRPMFIEVPLGAYAGEVQHE